MAYYMLACHVMANNRYFNMALRSYTCWQLANKLGLAGTWHGQTKSCSIANMCTER